MFHQIKIFTSLFLFFLFIFYVIAYLNYLRIEKHFEKTLSSKEEYLEVSINNIFDDNDTLLKSDKSEVYRKKYFIILKLYDEISMQLDINNLHFKTDCALDKIKYKFILNIICYDSLSHAQNVVMKSFREGDFFFSDYDELQNFKISNGNLLNIKKIVKEKKKKLVFSQYLSEVYLNEYNALNFIFISLIAAATVFTILKKRL